MLRSGNPALTDATFSRSLPLDASDRMTLEGTTTKGLILLGLLLASATYTWSLASSQGSQAVTGHMMLGVLGGFVVAMITIFKRDWAHVTAPLYALLQGLFLGALSALYNARFEGLPMTAVILTATTFLGLLLAYKSRLIRATENFKLGVFAATAGIALFYLASIVMSFFGVQAPLIHDNGALGIGFSLVVVTVAALNLVMDFDFIERGVERGASKQLEWYAAFGLLITLIWLYVEILRLLAKLQSRR